MTVQRTHGALHPQAPRWDELARGEASLEPDPQAMPKPPYGIGTAEAREAGRRGGTRRAGSTALANRLGLAPIASQSAFEPYKRAAQHFRKTHCQELSRSVGGGYCGPGPSSMVASAALQLAASRVANSFQQN